ncbi:2-aminoethanethiol (cysteamine) dioxygenase a [Clupea harengus]|uniref:2-aminoethanethiol (Cysteamine) dioxygenase a n=1 Tax=Clupea harengus TaxID=7950 RepID=A0A6P3WBY0_CLUHA|nr:2-aminoethanethiol (cysteamine) dioxygenase a [Clupea harengus]
MPRDIIPSLIQKIATQAYATFKHFGAAAIVDNNVFLDNQAKLTTLVTEIRAADLKITPPKSKGSMPSVHNPPVTYMHICETDAFSMGVFLLKRGASIPLHDHPGMNGVLKVLYGKVNIRCFDKLDKPPDAETEPVFDPPLMPFQKDALRRSVLKTTGEYTEDSGPCILSPVNDNLHQIDAVEGPAAFLDILAPPYDPDDGRDCHYFKVLQPVSKSVDRNSEQTVEGETWLLEVPQPADFWCGGEPYPGPEASV